MQYTELCYSPFLRGWGFKIIKKLRLLIRVNYENLQSQFNG